MVGMVFIIKQIHSISFVYNILTARHSAYFHPMEIESVTVKSFCKTLYDILFVSNSRQIQIAREEEVLHASLLMCCDLDAILSSKPDGSGFKRK
jgi:hypothetical protein